MNTLPEDIRKVIEDNGLAANVIEGLRDQLVSGLDFAANNLITGALKRPSPADIETIPDTESALSALRETGYQALRDDAAGLLVLNGGMATRFGGKVKGAVEVADGTSFLGFKLRDALRVSEQANAQPPIVILMNSIATSEPTKRHLEANAYFGYPQDRIWMMNQCWSVRFNMDGTVARDDEGHPSFYGPGHGDVVHCLRSSGLLKRFVSQGGKRLLLSNVDNIVASLDPVLLGMHCGMSEDILVEVVDRWDGDRGGAPIWVDGQRQIVEAFRLPPDMSLESIPYFNTNTFWLHVDAFSEESDLTWFCVKKKMNGNDVVQFERLVGELSAFVSSAFVHVSRESDTSRFIPVKTPEDLANNRDWVLQAWQNR